MSTISFIIPAYNAEAYLLECLDSIHALDIDKEVIVVNDGSTDGTYQLLQEYAAHYAIKTIHQENRGLSEARNAGMEIAEGDYLCFVDADDRLCDCDLSSILRYMSRGIDIIGIEMVEYDFQGRRYPYRRYRPPYHKVYRRAEEFMRGRNLMPCAVAYLYRREFLDSNHLRFYPGIYHEDEEFTPRVFAAGETFVATETVLYERILRPDSITTTPDKARQERKLRDMIFILGRLYRLKEESMQCKLDWLAVDTLRLLIRQKHSPAFCREIIASLATMGYFPLRWQWQWKYILFNLYTRILFR